MGRIREKSLSNPTVKPHLPGHTSGNANEAVPSGGGSASEGPSPFGLLRCRESYRGHIKGSELHYKGPLWICRSVIWGASMGRTLPRSHKVKWVHFIASSFDPKPSAVCWPFLKTGVLSKF